MDQKITDSAFCDANGFGGCGSLSTQLGGDENLPHCFGGGVVHSHGIDFQKHHAVGCIESPHRFSAAMFLLLVFQPVGCAKRKKIQGFPAGVKVKHPFGQRQQGPLEIIRNFFGDAPFRVSREGTVHVAAVNRGGPFSGLERRVVHRRNQNHPSPDLSGVDCSGQVKQRDRAFVFISVISPGEEGGGSLAVFSHADGNHHGPISGFVMGMGKFQKTMLQTILFKIDG